MARPVTISDEQILDSARTLFARDGLAATTKEIARLAGVSEGSVFSRFPTKEALFLAAVRVPPVPPWVQSMDEMLGRGSLPDNLVRLATEMVDFARRRLPLLVVLWASKLEPPEEPEGAEAPASRDRRRLADYLRQEVRAGRLRPCDTEAAAQMLFGACLSFVMEPAHRKTPPSAEQVESWARGLVDALWRGLSPQAGGAEG